MAILVVLFQNGQHGWVLGLAIALSVVCATTELLRKASIAVAREAIRQLEAKQ